MTIPLLGVIGHYHTSKVTKTPLSLGFSRFVVRASDTLWNALTFEEVRQFIETNIDLAVYKALDLLHTADDSEQTPSIWGTYQDAFHKENSSQVSFTIVELAALTYTILASILVEKARHKTRDNVSVTIVNMGLFEKVVEKLAWFSSHWFATPKAEMMAYHQKKEVFDELCSHLDFGEIMRLAMVNEYMNEQIQTSSLHPVSFAMKTDIGGRKTNEDRAFGGERLLEDVAFFGVYDGHGTEKVAAHLANNFHRVFAKKARRMNNIPMALVGSFASTEACLAKEIKKDINLNGSTANVAAVTKDVLYVANAGDSRAVLARAGQAILMSNDHCMEREDELKRIRDAGGEIYNFQGLRVMGVLNMTRAIGDFDLKPYVISEPELVQVPRQPDDDFLLLASDGLWNAMSTDEVLAFTYAQINEMTQMCGSRQTAFRTAASRLVERALQVYGHKSDNITVVLVDLRQ